MQVQILAPSIFAVLALWGSAWEGGGDMLSSPKVKQPDINARKGHSANLSRHIASSALTTKSCSLLCSFSCQEWKWKCHPPNLSRQTLRHGRMHWTPSWVFICRLSVALEAKSKTTHPRENVRKYHPPNLSRHTFNWWPIDDFVVLQRQLLDPIW